MVSSTYKAIRKDMTELFGKVLGSQERSLKDYQIRMRNFSHLG
jgi:hypothetical protein